MLLAETAKFETKLFYRRNLVAFVDLIFYDEDISNETH